MWEGGIERELWRIEWWGRLQLLPLSPLIFKKKTEEKSINETK